MIFDLFVLFVIISFVGAFISIAGDMIKELDVWLIDRLHKRDRAKKVAAKEASRKVRALKQT